MSRRLFSLEGTRSARANPRRYEIPVRMCLEWLVVRPLASIKSTTELLLVMADILTALGGTGAGANTHVFEVKHGEISHSHLHKCAHTHTHTQGTFVHTHTLAVNVLRQQFCQQFCRRRRELLNKQKDENKSFYLFFSLVP